MVGVLGGEGAGGVGGDGEEVVLAGDVEYEYGVPIPGKILPRERWSRTAIKHLPPGGPLDWAVLFGRSAPLILDLGCGNGRFTLASALRRPECDHFACDVLAAAIRYATRRANQRGLSNVRFAVKDARSFLRYYVAPGSAAEIHLYHPQPYAGCPGESPRILAPGFLSDLHRALVPGGLFVTQTDHPGYWRYMLEVLPHFFEFHEEPGPWADAPEGRTRREIAARQKGLRIFRGQGRRRDEVSLERAANLRCALPHPRFPVSRRGRRRKGSRGKA